MVKPAEGRIIFMNVGLLKHPFCVVASWRQKQMLQVSTVSCNTRCCMSE